jgi:NACalpha-BTF3-like transcription factor
MTRLYTLAIALMAALLMGCAQIGVQPKTFEDHVAVSTSSITQVRKVARVLLEAGKISKADAQNVQDQADVAREGVNIALALRSTDPAAAQNKLTAAIAVLRALDAYLAAKQGAAS